MVDKPNNVIAIKPLGVVVAAHIQLAVCSLAWGANLGNLPFGQVLTGAISSTAQTNSYTFSANAGDIVDFTMVATSGGLSPKIRLYNPDATLLSQAFNNNGIGGCFGGSTVEMNTVTLKATGTHTVLVGDCSDTNTGNYSIYVQRTNSPAGSVNLPFGQVQAGSIGSITERNSYTFSASINDVIDFTTTASGSLSPKVRLYNPDGTLLSQAFNNNGIGGCFGGPTVEMNTVTLKSTGTYTLLIGDCADTTLGTYTLYAQRTNNPAGAVPIQPGGQPQVSAIVSPTQRTTYTLLGSANDVWNFTVVATSGSLSPKIRVYNTNGTLNSQAFNNNGIGGCFGGSTVELNNVKIPTAGNYTVLVGDCADTNIGNYNISAQCLGLCLSSTGPTPYQFLPLTPCRIVDTRNANNTFGGPFFAAGTTRLVPILSSACGVPANAAAYSLNVTIVPRNAGAGYLTSWPTGQPQPVVSTVNWTNGAVVSNAAIVPAGTSGSINVFASNDIDLIIDIDGAFAPSGAATLQFYPLTPCRLFDTRNGLPITGGTSRGFVIPGSCGVPASALAFSFNVTVVPRGPLGYLTAWPTGQSQPVVSTLNSSDGRIVADAALVPSGLGGAVSFYASNTTDLVLDINGYFAVPGTGGLNFYTVTPCRTVDTRGGNPPTMAAGTTRTFQLGGTCGLPTTASAFSLNFTVVPQGPLGYLTTWPNGQSQPVVSTLNSSNGWIVANAALVPAGSGGSINVFVTNTTDVVIDTNGYFAP